MDWSLVTYSPPSSVVAGSLALAAAYWLCTTRYADRFTGSRPVSIVRKVAFYSGIVFALLALASPLDAIADRFLFTAHMLQHLLLTLAVAPLLLAGTPDWLLRDVLQATHLTGFVRWARHPLVAFGVFNLVFSLAHIPVFYELTLTNEPLHALEHLLFIATAMLTWMPVLSPVPEIAPPYPALGQVLYLFLQSIPAGLVGSLLSLTSATYYLTYEMAPRLTGLSPVEDQQLGGLLMWVGGGVYFLIAASVVFFAWAGREEAADRSHGYARS